MSQTGIVTDSTAYLSPEQKKELQVEVVSLVVNFEGESAPEEGLYSSFQEFYDRLRKVSYLPTTSQPSVGDFLQVYEGMAARGVESIISIHITAGISGTVHTALSAAKMLPHLDISVIDSEATALGAYMMVEAAARAALAGWERDEILRVLRYIIDHRVLIFMPDTLEYLRRGGRIGGAAAMVGTLLQIIPLLFFNPEKNHIIDVYEKVRTKERATKRMLEELEKAYRLNPALKITVSEVGARKQGEELIDRIKSLFPELSPELCPVGPVIGAHIGPGTLAVSCYPLTEELKGLVKY